MMNADEAGAGPGCVLPRWGVRRFASAELDLPTDPEEEDFDDDEDEDDDSDRPQLGLEAEWH